MLSLGPRLIRVRLIMQCAVTLWDFIVIEPCLLAIWNIIEWSSIVKSSWTGMIHAACCVLVFAWVCVGHQHEMKDSCRVDFSVFGMYIWCGIIPLVS